MTRQIVAPPDHNFEPTWDGDTMFWRARYRLVQAERDFFVYWDEPHVRVLTDAEPVKLVGLTEGWQWYPHAHGHMLITWNLEEFERRCVMMMGPLDPPPDSANGIVDPPDDDDEVIEPQDYTGDYPLDDDTEPDC